MRSEALVPKLASIVARECGSGAATAAVRELKQSIALGDRQRARTWGSVCTLLAERPTGRESADWREPRLDELLQGSVTQAVMAADGTQPEAVRDLVAGKAREIDEEDRGRE